MWADRLLSLVRFPLKIKLPKLTPSLLQNAYFGNIVQTYLKHILKFNMLILKKYFKRNFHDTGVAYCICLLSVQISTRRKKTSCNSGHKAQLPIWQWRKEPKPGKHLVMTSGWPPENLQKIRPKHGQNVAKMWPIDTACAMIYSHEVRHAVSHLSCAAGEMSA